MAPDGEGNENEDTPADEPNCCKRCCFGCLDCMATCLSTILVCMNSVWRKMKEFCFYPMKENLYECYDRYQVRRYPYKQGVKVPYTHVPGFTFGGTEGTSHGPAAA
mmetsp:Transcript_106331/g.299129  ORF Transcript_106331/g.299129 Transcript_106331/m.299129 type:complete len:106 (-) Transcript_106331:110-427(-)